MPQPISSDYTNPVNTNIELLLKSSIISKSKYKINGDESICNFPYLVPKETLDNIEFNNQINTMLNSRDNLTDEEFGYYLAGLLEGDGHCTTDHIAITFHIYDTSLALYIKNRLKVGEIYKIPKKNCVSLIFRDKQSKIEFINFVNGKFYTQYKIKFMEKHNYEDKLNIKLLPPIDSNRFPILNNHFLAGFTDSDGNFDLNLQNNNLKTRYRISQKDLTIINILKAKIGGTISMDNKANCGRYQAVASDIIIKYIEYFDKYKLLSTKYINYLKWKKAVEIKQIGNHLTIKGWEEILNIKNNINSKLNINFNLPSLIEI